MNAALQGIGSLAPLLAAGVTVLLGLGCLAARLNRSPVHRQRIGELTLAATLVWLVLACIPLPRMWGGWMAAERGDQSPAAAERIANIAVIDKAACRVPLALPVPSEHTGSTGTASGTQDAVLPTLQPAIRQQPQLLNEAQLAEIARLQRELRQLGDVAATDPAAPLPPPVPAEPTQNAAIDVQPQKQETASAMPIGPWLARLYLFGAAGCIAWLLIGQFMLVRLRRTADAAPHWLDELHRALAVETGVPLPRLLVSRRAARPLSWGAWRPVVSLPARLCRRDNLPQLRSILLHELAHVAQRDAWGNSLFCFALPLLYLHPLYWRLRADVRMAAELVADDWAAGHTDKEAYIEQLVALAMSAERSAARRLPLLGAAGVFTSPSPFFRRMHMLLSRKTPLATRSSRTWRLGTLAAMSAAVALATAALGVRPVAGQTTPKTDVPPAPLAETPMPPKPVDPNVPKPKEPTPPPTVPGPGGPASPGGGTTGPVSPMPVSPSGTPSPGGPSFGSAPPPGLAPGQPHTGGLKPATPTGVPGPGSSAAPGAGGYGPGGTPPAVIPGATTPGGGSVPPGVGIATPPGASGAPAPGGSGLTSPAGIPGTGAPPSAIPGAPGGLAPPPAVGAPDERRALDADVEKLRAERAKLEAEMKVLRDRLQRLEYGSSLQAAGEALKSKVGGDPILAATKSSTMATLNRIDGDGRMRTEAWTLDKDNRPSKLLSSTVTGDPLGKPHQTMIDGKHIYRMFKRPDGTSLVLIYELSESKEEKLIGAEMRSGDEVKTNATPTKPRLPQPMPAGMGRGAPGGFDRGTAPPPAADADPSVPSSFNPGDGSGPAPSTRAVPPAGAGARVPGGSGYGDMGSGLLGGGEPMRAGGGGLMGMAGMPGLGAGDSSGGGHAGLLKLDLVTLATNYADAVAAVEYAKAALDHYQEQGDKVSGGELAMAKARVSGAVRKEQLLRQIVEVSYAAAKTEAKRTSEAVKAGVISMHEAPDSEARMLILEQILKTR